jgi:hypothetical protein
MTELVLCAKCEKMGHVAFSPIYRFGIDERLYVKEGMKFTISWIAEDSTHSYSFLTELEITEFLGVEYIIDEDYGRRRLFCTFKFLGNSKRQKEKLSIWKRLFCKGHGNDVKNFCSAVDSIGLIVVPSWIEKEYKERLIQKEKYAKELLARIEEVSTPTNYLKKVKSKRKKK